METQDRTWMTMNHGLPHTDPDIRESARALIQEHGRHAQAYALARAAQLNAHGKAPISRQWAAVAVAIDDISRRSALTWN